MATFCANFIIMEHLDCWSIHHDGAAVRMRRENQKAAYVATHQAKLYLTVQNFQLCLVKMNFQTLKKKVHHIMIRDTFTLWHQLLGNYIILSKYRCLQKWHRYNYYEYFYTNSMHACNSMIMGN